MVRKLSSLLIISVAIISSCSGPSETKESTGEMLDKAIDAHGGISTYQNLREVSYSKTTILYDSVGNIESEITQHHRYNFEEEIAGTISWHIDTSSHLLEFKGSKIEKFINGIKVDDQSAQSLVNSSFFVLFQPFKLKDPGVTIMSLETDFLGSDEKYRALMPVYEGESSDQWLFYLEPEGYRVIANLVNHNGRYSFIENIEFDETTGLILHKHRKSYFTDERLKSRLLRAEYWYKNYQIDTWD